MMLSKNVQFKCMLRGDTAAVNTTIQSTQFVDMAGFEGCLFVGTVVEVTAGGDTTLINLVPQMSTAATTAALTAFGSTAIAGYGIDFTTGEIGKLLYVDVYRPTERYLTCKWSNPTPTAELAHRGPIIAIAYGAHDRPITPSTATAGVADYKESVSFTT